MAVPQPVIATEVDDIRRNGHDECGTESSPQRKGALISRNLLEAIDGRVECLALCFLNCTVGCCCSSIAASDAKLPIVPDPEDFFATRRHTEIGR